MPAGRRYPSRCVFIPAGRRCLQGRGAAMRNNLSINTADPGADRDRFAHTVFPAVFRPDLGLFHAKERHVGRFDSADKAGYLCRIDAEGDVCCRSPLR